jgi:predicted RecB family nuclease
MTKPKISKTQYFKGLRCKLSLWLSTHERSLATPPDSKQQASFDDGNEIGEVAKGFFKEKGEEVTNPYYDIFGSVKATDSFIEDGAKLIFEATAMTPQGVYCRIDALGKVSKEGEKDQWDMVEVKSSQKVADYHITDLAFQKMVFEQAGYNIRNIFLLCIDPEYKRKGDLDPKKLFKLTNLTKEANSKMPEIISQIPAIIKAKEQEDLPKHPLSSNCKKPFSCEFAEHCWKDMPKYSMHDLFKAGTVKHKKLVKLGVEEIKDISDDFELSPTQAVIAEAEKTGEIVVDKKKLRKFLDTIKYPLYFFDYETIFPIVPLFDDSGSKEQVPFQYSLHVQKKPGEELDHTEYIHGKPGDPRKELAASVVKNLGKKGSVLAYFSRFEADVNRRLGELFPEHKNAMYSINSRMVDLFEPFSKKTVYCKEMEGSASLKKVLPALVPELSYQDLEIQEGGDASRRYLEFVKAANFDDAEDTLKALLEYCKLDTFALVKVLDKLRELAE